MKCPNCQTELPDNAKFCNRCGKSLQTELICSRCQHSNPSNSSFCIQCGQPTHAIYGDNGVGKAVSFEVKTEIDNVNYFRYTFTDLNL